MQGINITDIIETCKKDFTRDRKSVIREFLESHNDVLITSLCNKTRGASLKLYYKNSDGKVVASDYVLKNALVIVKTAQESGIKVYSYDKKNNTIKSYKSMTD